MSLKEDKIREIIRMLAAEFFSRESNRTSLITITNVALKSGGSIAVILVTVLPVEKEEDAVSFIHRRLGDFREYVQKHSRIARVPFFEVGIDVGEKNRQHIDEIAQNIIR